MNAFHVLGALTAVWAVILAVIGLRSENFPGRWEKLVAAVSILLVTGAISSAIITSALADEEESGAEEATLEAER